MSPAAAGLLRALISRAGVTRDRILLSDAHSVNWQSLTFSGERHELHLRVSGADSRAVASRMCKDLEDAEFSIPAVIVADITVMRNDTDPDGSACITIEALTVEAD